MSVESNKELVRRFFNEVMDAGNVAAIPDFCAPNGFLAGGLRNFVQSFKIGFPDSQYGINDIFGEGDKVAVDVAMRGVNTGPWQGRPATGKPIDVGVIYIFTVKDDKVQSLKFESNQMLFMQQLGWMPTPEQG